LRLSPSSLGGEGWGEGCFLHEKHQTPFVPSARAIGRIEGPAPASPPVILSAAKNLASPPHLKPRGVRWHACRILLTPERSFSPAASYFLVAVDKKVTRHQGGTALSISRQMVRAQARASKFQSAIPTHPDLRQNAQLATAQ
jgi:hypothetical protein